VTTLTSLVDSTLHGELMLGKVTKFIDFFLIMCKILDDLEM